MKHRLHDKILSGINQAAGQTILCDLAAANILAGLNSAQDLHASQRPTGSHETSQVSLYMHTKASQVSGHGFAFSAPQPVII